MTNPAKAYLMRYRAELGKVAALEQAIADARERATNTTAPLKDIVVQTSGGAGQVEAAVVSLVDATRQLDEMRSEAVDVMNEILRAINSVRDDVQQTILIEKYVNGRSLTDIQNTIHYERRNTQIIHGRALWAVYQYMIEKGLTK